MLSLTLITHGKVFPQNNFNTPTMIISGINFGSSLRSVMDQFNQSRSQSAQIKELYNSYGQIIPHRLWDIQIKENMSLFIDRETSSHK